MKCADGGRDTRENKGPLMLLEGKIFSVDLVDYLGRYDTDGKLINTCIMEELLPRQSQCCICYYIFKYILGR